jgi:hypothetical protein
MQKDRLLLRWNGPIMPAVEPGMPERARSRQAFKNCMKKGEIAMSTRVAFGRRFSRPAAKVVSRPRELFGESLPELLLLMAVVAAVVSALLAL